MKVVHNSAKRVQPDANFEDARELEQQGHLEDAASVYEKIIGEESLNEVAYERLMIIYRKLKDPKKELAVINKGIKAFEGHYSSSRPSSNKKISELSSKLLKSTGLADKKGKLLYEPEPISRWKKRRTLVEKKLK